MSKDDFEEAKALAKTFLKAIEEAIELTENVEFARKNDAVIAQVLESIKPALDNMLRLSHHLSDMIPDKLKATMASLAGLTKVIPKYEFATVPIAISHLQNTLPKNIISNTVSYEMHSYDFEDCFHEQDEESGNVHQYEDDKEPNESD